MNKLKSPVAWGVLMLSHALLADALFTGAVSKSWGEPGNWDPVGVPTSGNVTIPADRTVEVEDAQLASVNGLTKLTLDGETAKAIFRTTGPFTCAIAGNGEVVKASTSTWTLSRAQSDFTGAFTLIGGVTKIAAPGRCQAFGSSAAGVGPLTVTNNASVDICCDAEYNFNFGLREVRIAGTGYDGTGVLLNSGKQAYGVFRRLTLVGDATVYFANRVTSDTVKDFIFNMNGHTFTQTGKEEFIWYYGSVTNAGHHILSGKSGATTQLRVVNTFDSLGEAGSGPLEIGSYAYLNYYGPPKHERPARFSGTANSRVYLNAARGWDTNYNNFAGPVEIANGATVDVKPTDSANYKCMLTFAGPLSGGGTINLDGYGKLGLGCPTNATPAYTGSINITGTDGASLIAYFPASIPDYSKLTVNRSRVTVPMDTWTKADIVRLANTATFKNHAVVEVDTSALEGQTGSLTLTDTDMTRTGFGLGHDGPGTLNLFGPFSKALKIGVHDGTLKLTGSERITIGEATVGGDGGSCSGTLAVEDAADVVQVEETWVEVGGAYPSNGNSRPRPKMTVRNAKYVQDIAVPGLVHGGGVHLGNKCPGLMEFGEGADFAARVVSGYTGTFGHSGIRQTGGSVWLFGRDYEDNGTYQNSVIGYEGYGYYGISGGSLTLEGWLCFGHWGSNCQGVLEQAGGTVTHKLHRNPNGKSVSTYWALGNLDGSTGAYYLRGGKLVDEGRIFVPYCAGANGIMTIEGATAEAEVADYIRVGHRPGVQSSALCIVNGGRLTTPLLCGSADAGWENMTNSVNFNGGTLRATASGGGNVLVNASVRNLLVYAGGATFDTNGRTDEHIATPIRAPVGQGVVAAAVPAAIAGGEFLGAPFMRVTGDGVGAVVAADWNPTTRRVTGVRVVSPGSGYTSATLVTRYGNSNYVDSVALTLGAVSGGGITKAGEGVLVLDATNTYAGATVLAGGTLKCGIDGAIPANSTVVFAGGKLDMNGKKLSDGSALPKTWAVDVRQVEAGGTVVYDGDVTFADGAVLRVLNLETLAEDSPIEHVLFRVTGTVTGSPTVEAGENEHWRVGWRGNVLRLIRNRGLMLIVR